LFKHQFQRSLKGLKKNKSKDINTTPYVIVTGVAAYRFMEEIAEKLREIGFNVKVEKIHNEFFGHNITVAGLVVGKDIINQLKDKINEEVLVDDTTVEEIEKELGTKVIVSEVDGKKFLQKIQSGR
jgi:NifB/MoaA-like Fe-S oxidoreductase